MSQNFEARYNGLDNLTPLLNGEKKRYINFDNAASTPPLARVERAVNNFMQYYSSVHRGTGFKSQLATHIFEETRDIILNFVGADPEEHVCIFGKNTSESLNKLANRFPFTAERDLVITTGMEHHSNDLPWRKATDTIHVSLHKDGQLNLNDLYAKMEQYKDRLALVAITGASNVTGFMPPTHEIAERAHALGAQIAVDCAQLAPHRKIDMLPLNDPCHFDYITIAGHKMYAPYGTGALIGRRDTFSQGDPDMVGGGTVKIVTLEEAIWDGPPERDEAGSPNTAGAVALGAAICELVEIGMDAVAQHEADLTEYALKRMTAVPEIEIYGDADPNNTMNRLGVIPFNLKGVSHFLVAAVLGHEFGIGVRNGCFCAHPYILHLLGLTHEEAQQVQTNIMADDKSEMPGLVRASFGLYNATAEVDALVDALKKIIAGDYAGNYVQDKVTGEYHPENWEPGFEKYFSF